MTLVYEFQTAEFPVDNRLKVKKVKRFNECRFFNSISCIVDKRN